MEKPQIHRSVIIAWDLANQEAWHNGFSTIEPIHFLIGILLFCDGLYDNDISYLDTSPDSTNEFRNITSKCLANLKLSEEEATKVRRKLQSLMHVSCTSPSHLLHRSAKLKKIFSQAEEIALSDGKNSLILDHLAEAIIQYLPFNVNDLPSNLDSILSNSIIVDALEFKTALEMRMMGQQGTIDQIVRVFEEIQKESQLSEKTNKICLFYGPPGSGKLIAAEVIAEIIFSRRNQVLRIDLSEFDDDGDVDKLAKIISTFIQSQDTSVHTNLGNAKIKGVILIRNFEYSSPLILGLISNIFENSQLGDENEEKMEIKDNLIILNLNSPDERTNLFSKYNAIKFCQYFIKFANTDLDSFIDYFSELFGNFQKEFKEIIIEIDDTSRMNTIIWLSDLARDKYGFSYVFDKEIANPIKQVFHQNENIHHVSIIWSPKGIIIQV